MLRCLVLSLSLLTTVCLPAIAKPASHEAELARQRQQFQLAWAAAQQAPAGAWRKLAQGLEGYPLFPYLIAADLSRRLNQANRDEVEKFLNMWTDSLPARDLRESYLLQLANNGQWKDFRQLYVDSKKPSLRCAAVHAAIAAGETPEFERDIAPLWLSASAAPGECDEVFVWARQQGKLDAPKVWQRIELAANAGHADVVAGLAAMLDGAEREAAERTAAILRDPAATLDTVGTWPDAPRSRNAIAWGLDKLAKRNSDAAETLWSKYSQQFHFDTEQRGRVLRALALYRATAMAPNALARLAALPAELQDDATREWRVRAAVAVADWKAALQAIDALSAVQQTDPHWRYLRARVLVKLDRVVEAQSLLSGVAREANFYGFLAADWLREPYTICPLNLARDSKAVAAVRALPGLRRAFEFHALDRLREARREWDFVLPGLDADQRRLAVDAATDAGWLDRAVFTLLQSDELRLYELRFPLARRSLVEHESNQAGIDAAWTYSIIRAESAWVADAHSGADAYGLMQLLPGTAASLAKSEKLSYSGAADLYNPAINIPLGTRYLANMAARYQGSPWLASAAYNAGPEPVDRWLAQRSTLEPDFFIETIPYKETREYVSRVLAFSVIHDWRLHGDVAPLAGRMPRIGQLYSPPAADAPRKGVQCLAPAQSAQAGPATAPAAAPSN